jgi:hypothetical protein
MTSEGALYAVVTIQSEKSLRSNPPDDLRCFDHDPREVMAQAAVDALWSSENWDPDFEHFSMYELKVEALYKKLRKEYPTKMGFSLYQLCEAIDEALKLYNRGKDYFEIRKYIKERGTK